MIVVYHPAGVTLYIYVDTLVAQMYPNGCMAN